MDTNHILCNSCQGTLINQSGSVTFNCPQCNNHSVSRCKHCRSISAHYSCPACEFTGPN